MEDVPKQDISICEKNLKSSMEREEFNKIEKTTKDIEKETKFVFDQCKFKNVKYLNENLQTISEDKIKQ